MSYSSRVYRQRNAHTHDEKNSDAFFGKQHDDDKTKSGNFFQDRLTVNKPGDNAEKEADAMASAVVNNRASGPSLHQQNGSTVQRLASASEDEKLSTNDARMKKDKDIQTKQESKADDEKKKKPVQKKGDGEKEKDKPAPKMDAGENEKEKKKPVQTKPEGGNGAASPVLSSRIEGAAGKGKSLPDKTLHEMNSAFGKDFSDVKIHHDTEAAEMNKELDAQAFTHGKDIYFNEGKFDTENASGKNLLAHELTHVVQQNNK
jgi:hypothetical protein